MTLTDPRLLVHDVVLLTEAGVEVPLKIDPAAPWQNDAVALIDLEDGQGACETGSPGSHAALTGHTVKGAYSGPRFTVGAPFALNHADHGNPPRIHVRLLLQPFDGAVEIFQRYVLKVLRRAFCAEVGNREGYIALRYLAVAAFFTAVNSISISSPGKARPATLTAARAGLLG